MLLAYELNNGLLYISYLIDHVAIICDISCDFDNRILANGKWRNHLLKCHLRFFSDVVLR